MGAISQAGSFLISIIFNFFLFILLLRIIMQYIGVSYYNPVAQFVIKCTNFLVLPVRKIIPRTQSFDGASILIAYIVTVLKFLFLAFTKGLMPSFVGLLAIAIPNLLSLLLNVFFFIVLIAIILSWIGPRSYSPIVEIINQLAEPLLRPARRIIPPIAGFDLSPIVVLIILKLLDILFVTPLTNMASGLL